MNRTRTRTRNNSLKRLLVRNNALIRLLNINIHSKPVLLFLLSVSSTSVVLLLLNLAKLYNLLKKKISKRSPQKSLSQSYNRYRTVNVPYKNKIIKVRIDQINHDKYDHDKLIFKKFLKDRHHYSLSQKNSSIIESKVLEKIFIIWKLILIPKVFHKNTYLLLSQVACLVARTWLTLLVTKLDGEIMKDLIGLKGKLFIRDLIYWFLIAVPSSYINSGIKYLTNRLSLNFRTNLVRYCHDLYMDSRLVYYKLQFNDANDPEYKVDFKYIDQNLTEDISKFTTTLTNLFSNVGKPAIDLVFFAIYLRDNIGSIAIMGILFNYFITGYFMKLNSPNFNKLWKIRTYLEGIYYNYQLNLINNCEEISFYKGVKFERTKISKIFNNLLNHINWEINLRFNYQLLEEYILKFTWPGFGYLFASFPIFFESTSVVADSTANMKSFTVNKRLILSMADAGSRLMYSIKDISTLAGITDTVFNLLVNLHQVHDNNFQYGLKSDIGFGSSIKMNSFVSKSRLQLQPLNNNGMNGTIQYSYPGLRLEDIPIIVPSSQGSQGSKLVDHLTFQLKKGQSCLILGKNSTGKTSIIRLISELWPLYSGLLSKPNSNDLLYVSQKSYFLSNGSLRDQIIYPLNHMDMLSRGFTDDELLKMLDEVGLSYLIDRFGSLDYNPAMSDDQDTKQSLIIDEVMVNGKKVMVYDSNTSGSGDTKKSWSTLLSGGEKQKLIFARILFHNKPFVILDEPTSAISYDFEDLLFELLKSKGFSVVTVSSRDSLIRYHDYLLHLGTENEQRWEFKAVDQDYLKQYEDADSEIKYLEKELIKAEELKKRKHELIGLLDGYEDLEPNQ